MRIVHFVRLALAGLSGCVCRWGEIRAGGAGSSCLKGFEALGDAEPAAAR